MNVLLQRPIADFHLYDIYQRMFDPIMMNKVSVLSWAKLDNSINRLIGEISPNLKRDTDLGIGEMLCIFPLDRMVSIS